jgi:phosphate:Na+ symporter
MLELLMIAGGVALILFGGRFIRKGLDRLFGPRMGVWMQRFSLNRLRAFAAGAAIGAIMPSSTTLSLLAVQTVQSGQMGAREMLAVMLGANIGLTIMVQFLALRLDQYAPIFVLVGVSLFSISRSTFARGLGQVVLSLGFIYLAMGIISSAARAAVASNADIAQALALAEKYPLALTALAMLLTMALQSSTATLGLVMALGATIAEPLRVALPAVVGANVGLAVTTLMVGWRQRDSRTMAMSNLALKALVGVAVLAALPWVSERIKGISGKLEVEVAMAHTGFNLLVALVGLPLVGVFSGMVERYTPAPVEPEKFGPKYLAAAERADNVPLALGQSMREILRASEIVREMLDQLWRALKENDAALAEEVGERDDQIDLLDTQIKMFLTRVIAKSNEPEDAVEQMRQLRYINELETVGDIIDKNLSELAEKKARLRAEFSKEGWQELNDFFQKVTENLVIADTVFTTRDRMLAQKLLRHKERLGHYEHELRDRHFARLRAGLHETQETSAIHLDVLTHLKRINSCITHVAYDIIQAAESQSRA